MNIQGIQPNLQTDIVGKKNAIPPRTAFSKVMEEVKAHEQNIRNQSADPGQASLSSSLSSMIGEGLVTYIKNWANTDQALERAMKKVGNEYRSVVELQRAVHQVSLHTEVMSRVGDSLSSSIRRVEQMGNS